MPGDDAAELFATHRPLMFTVAYEILGTATDADDVLQEAYLKWSGVDASTVSHPRAYLVRTVARLALNHLRTVARRREEYIGNWVPEPVQTVPDVADDVLLAGSVSMAMLLVLETLAPVERAVFVLREVFGCEFAEIAAIVDKSEPAVRQILHRARSHVTARRRRFEPDNDETREIVAAFLWAAGTGDVDLLAGLLAPDVVQMSDGGGHATAAKRPVEGRDAVAHFTLGIARTSPPASAPTLIACNGLPAVVYTDTGGVATALVFEIADGLIHRFYAIRNPEKLGATHERLSLARS